MIIRKSCTVFELCLQLQSKLKIRMIVYCRSWTQIKETFYRQDSSRSQFNIQKLIEASLVLHSIVIKKETRTKIVEEFWIVINKIVLKKQLASMTSIEKILQGNIRNRMKIEYWLEIIQGDYKLINTSDRNRILVYYEIAFRGSWFQKQAKKVEMKMSYYLHGLNKEYETISQINIVPF